MIRITHKRGDTFEHTLRVLQAAGGQGADMAGWAIAAEARQPQNAALVQAFTCEWIDANVGLHKVTAPSEDTQGWPIERIEFDIQFTSADGFVMSSETIAIDVLEDRTL